MRTDAFAGQIGEVYESSGIVQMMNAFSSFRDMQSFIESI